MKSKRGVLSDPRVYTREWATMNGISFDGKRRFTRNNQTEGRLSSLLGTMWLDYKQQLKAYNAKAAKGEASGGFDRTELELAFEEYVSDIAKGFLDEAKRKISCNSENLQPLEAFVKACMGEADPMSVGVLAHWIWMIKRKMNGKPVIDHIMPVLFGTQGSGKSTAVSRLISPVSDWRIDFKIDAITDSRNAHGLEENFVVVFDELQNAARSDVDCLKNAITTEELFCRKMRTNIVDKIRQNASFIGTTNKRVNEQIFDSTGMRRFFEIETLQKIDQDVINSLDYTALWQGVDEKKEDGYLKPLLPEISVAQEEMKAIDPIVEFIREFDLDKKSEATARIPTWELYDCYSRWCKKGGYAPKDTGWFGRLLKNRGIASLKGKERMYELAEVVATKVRQSGLVPFEV